MAGIKLFGRIRVVFQRSSTKLKVLLLAALVISTAALLTLHHSLLKEKDRAEDLRQQAVILEQENQKLERRNAMLDTVQSVKELAGELLGLVDPNTVIFEPVE